MVVLGPNYNLPGDKERGLRAWHAIEKARSLESGATPEERGLIEALAKRYGVDGAETAERDAQYADAMRNLAHRYPEDPDAQTIFAESLMDLHPWQLWTTDGKPGPNTPEVIATLETVLKKNPRHTGANHYYIHAVEASPDPAKGTASADRLRTLAPTAGHLVHMPSHIYIHTGRYHDASTTNIRAIAADRALVKATGENGLYPTMYLTHNVQFLCFTLMTEGRRREALACSRQVVMMVPVKFVREMPMAEVVEPLPYWTMVRFGDWDAILKEPAPPAELEFTSGMWHYSRGFARAEQGNLELAEREKSS